MAKVYLSPAYHRWNPCAIAGCDETTHNNLYLDELEPFLKACGIAFKRGPRRVPKSAEDGTALMNAAIKESNAWRPDIHYVSHTNAYNGTVKGYRPMIFPRNNEKGERLAEIMIRHRKTIYTGPVSLKRTDEWAELRETVAVAYYEEHVFHDNPEEARWFHDNLRSLARVTAKAFCEYLGVTYVEPYPQKPVEEKPPVVETPAPVAPAPEVPETPTKPEVPAEVVTPAPEVPEKPPETVPTAPEAPKEEQTPVAPEIPPEDSTESLLRKVLKWLLWFFETLFKKGE